MSTPRLLAFFLATLSASACDTEPAAPDAEPPAATTRDRLVAGPRMLAVLADQAAVSLEVQIRRGDGWDVYSVAPQLRHGSLSISAQPEGTIELGAAALWFDDILVGDKGVPPTGLYLTDVVVRTRAVHECEWVTWDPDGDACSAGIPAVLYLDWSIVMTDGVVVPLSTQELAPMDVWVDLARDDAGIAGDLVVVAPGPLWAWAGVVEFRDLELTAPAHELIPLAAP
jgi:hypothetical protein